MIVNRVKSSIRLTAVACIIGGILLSSGGAADDACLFQEGVSLSSTSPVVSTAGAFSGSAIYFSSFKMHDGPRWEGNIEKFGLSTSLDLSDKESNPLSVLSAGLLTTWVVDKAPIWETKDWTEPNSSRKIYTYLGSSANLASPTNEFSPANEGLTAAVLGGPEIYTAGDVVNYVRGADILDEDKDGDKSENRPTVTADVVNSEPEIVRYASRSVVFFGSNDGMLHAVNDADGKEIWGFIPPDQLHRLKYLLEGTEHRYYVDSSPKVYIQDVNGNGIVETAVDSDGDGDVDEADRDRAILVCGERKGGTSYFALDVTEPENAVFLWRISSRDDSRTGSLTMSESNSLEDTAPLSGEISKAAAEVAGGQNGETLRFKDLEGAFQLGEAVNGTAGVIQSISYDAPPSAGPNVVSDLGETWSEPVFGLVKASDDDKTGTPVFFIGGGYSADNSSGKAVLAIDVVTGAVVKRFSLQGMDYCFPSAVSAVDGDGDGFVDKVYVGDLGGRMWRFGKFTDSEGKSLDFPKADENINNWTGQVVFDAGCVQASCESLDDNPGCASRVERKFFYPPSVVLEKGYDLIFMGTGDKENACSGLSSDRVYCVKDANSAGTVTECDLLDVTDMDYSKERPDLSVCDGWFLRLGPGEKTAAQGLVLNRVLYVTTFLPTGAASGGEGRLYALDYKTGKPVLFYDEQDNSTPTRSKPIGGGMPSRPVLAVSATGARLFVSNGDTIDNGQSLGAGILALEPAGPPVNFHYLWWKEL